MMAEDLKTFVNITTSYFDSVTQKTADLGIPFIKNRENTFFLDYTGVIGISGLKKGAMYFTTSGGMLWTIAQILLPGEEEIGEEILMDIAGEIANTIAGNAREVFGENFWISVPFVFRGKPDEVLLNVQTPVYVIPIIWENFQSFLGIGLD
ncbi:chemotaxis protein CheX [Spirochaetia bacterium 38H-sp]|uniref:Chemotaxis protein CheX n=1 Tax=Rarispira pelagica TaxID=3141764 RepID=A0ABU9UD57_9SPIR